MDFWQQAALNIGSIALAWSIAKAQETGKLEARDAKLDLILKEVRAVTKETETIRADIDRGLFVDQRVWDARNSLFAEILHEHQEFEQPISREFEVGKRQFDHARAFGSEEPPPLSKKPAATEEAHARLFSDCYNRVLLLGSQPVPKSV